MKVGLSLGSNLGDRLRNLREAKEFLITLSANRWHQAAAIYETDPVGCPPNSPAFYNSVVEIEFAGTPQQLMKMIRAYEDAHGRERNLPKNAARRVDIDILYFGDDRVTDPDLTIPHPRMSERRFVMLPLSTIRPDLTAGRELPGTAGEVRLVRKAW